MPKTAISPKGLHKPPTYSQVVKAGQTVYLSGQTATDSQGNLVGKGDIEAQTVQVCENLKAALTAVGATFDNLVKVTVYITDIEHMPKMAEVRRRYYREPYPASTLLVISSLAQPDYLLEIDAIAFID